MLSFGDLQRNSLINFAIFIIIAVGATLFLMEKLEQAIMEINLMQNFQLDLRK